MKHVTHIIFCMLCMLCLFDATAVAQVNSSDEFFTLYFKDGTSRNFYTGDIISITHSNIDIDGTIYDEPVVQEICMITGAERYRLADIEEMSFERLNLPFDVRAYMKEWDDIHAVVDDLFMECDIIQELQKHKEEILALANVKDVYFDVKQGFMEVTLNDGTSQSWDYPIYGPDDDGSSRDELFAKAESKVKALAESNVNVHKPHNGKKVWIGNMLDRDQASNFVRGTKHLKELVGKLDKLGFEVVYTDKWDFSEASTSDIILFVTHGGYNDSLDYHYINTGIDCSSLYKNTGIDCSSLTYVLNYLSKPGSAISSTKINIGVKPNGEYIKDERMYFKIATQFIEEQVNLKENAVVFMGACSTMKGNNTFARAFTENGASTYIGFDNRTYIPAYLGAAFVYQLAKDDKSVSESFDYVAKSMGEMSTDKEWPWNKYDAEEHDEAGLFGGMEIQYRENDSSYGNLCFNHTSFSTAKPEECTIGEASAYLGVKIHNIEGLMKKYDGIKEIGILYSSDRLNWTGSAIKKIWISEYTWKNWEGGVILGKTSGTLEQEKQYWYRAYLKTAADEVVYGDVEGFVPHDEEARNELKKIYDQIGDKSWGAKWFDKNTPIEKWGCISLDETGYGLLLGLYEGKSTPKLVLNNLKRISRIEFPDNIDVFDSITITNCQKLKKISNYKTKQLRIDSCGKLEDVFIGFKQDFVDLETVDISNCPSIKSLTINGENLSTLNITNCKSLEKLYVANTKLSSLGILNCPTLKTINCSYNQIEGILDLSGAPVLEKLDCKQNRIQKVLITSPFFSDFSYAGVFSETNIIDQTYESIPNWKKLFVGLELGRKYDYKVNICDLEDIKECEKDGWTLFKKTPSEFGTDWYNCYFYRYRYDGRFGFYHPNEPNVIRYYENYWDF